MGQVYEYDAEKNRRAASSAAAAGKQSRSTGHHDAAQRLYDRARRSIDEGHIERALGQLNAAASNDLLKNAKGVCLLRLGRIDAALRLYRALVLKSNCTWMRPELPIAYKVNLCTALWLAGHPVGAANLLGDITEQSHPAVARFQEAIDRWTSKLPWYSRVLWACGFEPNVSPALDYEPGEFPDLEGALSNSATELPASPRTSDLVR